MTAPTVSHASAVVDSPVGPLLIAGDGSALERLSFLEGAPAVEAPSSPADPVLAETARQLAAYFAGERTSFDLPLAPAGSDFQLRVWEQLQRIRYGHTASYADVAAALGLPVSASRAVGLANGANPIAIVIPCHRVIGADGSLVGYGGGLHRKRLLLDLEAPTVQDALFDV